MAPTRRLTIAAVAALAALNALSAFRAAAVPRYSARYEQNCSLCHVNPTGGGMRSTYASQELVPKELAWSDVTPAIRAEIEPMIGKQVGIGTDFRQLYVAHSRGAATAARPGFFQMQGDLYLMFQLDPRVTLYYDRGLQNTYEVFGMAYLLPWSGYVKAGRFVPSYGWRFDDHTMFVRSELGFFPPANSDVGVEIGATPGRLDLQLALINGNRGSTQANDRTPAAALNAAYRFRYGPVAAAAGVAGYVNPGGLVDLYTGGVYGYLSGWNLTWLGQGDVMRRDPTAGGTVTGLVTSHELSVLLRQGLELKATYDFFDPNLDLESGSTSRWGGGVAVMPRSFVALEALVRRTRVEPGPELIRRGYGEAVVQLHFFY